MSRRVGLPVLGGGLGGGGRRTDRADAGGARLDADAARRALGGRGASDGPVGAVVALEGGSPGVVLFTAGDRVDVWHPPGTVRRTHRTALRPVAATSPEWAAAVAVVRRFAALPEGASLAWEDGEGRRRTGRIAEKCRFGALVVDDAGTLVALGFQRVALATLADPE